MLARLSIRDIVLIERLDIEFSRGLAVLTGETRAGKSILLDAFAGLEKEVAARETVWEARRTANTALDTHRASMERAAREADYLRHAADELKALKPKDGEETALAGRRTTMMQGEKIASDLREAQEAVSGCHSPVPALAAAVRRLGRRADNSPTLV